MKLKVDWTFDATRGRLCRFNLTREGRLAVKLKSEIPANLRGDSLTATLGICSSKEDISDVAYDGPS
jgi:hypothetical protein